MVTDWLTTFRSSRRALACSRTTCSCSWPRTAEAACSGATLVAVLNDTPGSSEPSWYLRFSQVWHSASSITSWGDLFSSWASFRPSWPLFSSLSRPWDWFQPRSSRSISSASPSKYWIRARTAISAGSAPSRMVGNWSSSAGWTAPRWTDGTLLTGCTGIVSARDTGLTGSVPEGCVSLGFLFW